MGSVPTKKLLMHTVKYYSQNSPSGCGGCGVVAIKIINDICMHTAIAK